MLLTIIVRKLNDMEVMRAARIFGIDPSEMVNANINDVKSTYRQLMRKHHPDLYMDNEELRQKHEKISKELNDAYDTISTFLEEVVRYKKIEEASQAKYVRALIPFQNFINLHNGKIIELINKTDGSKFTLTKFNVRAHNIMLGINCDIEIKETGEVLHFNKITPCIISDEYYIDCVLLLKSDLFSKPNIVVRAYGKEVKLKLRDNITSLKLKFDPRIFLTVRVEKKLA